MGFAISAFLSCLFGSEPHLLYHLKRCYFLSCLFGSEHRHVEAAKALGFLSCLFGSELAHELAVGRRVFSELPIRQ